LTIDDILRDEIELNTTLLKHSSLVKVSAALTMTLFVVGLINSALVFITFHNSKARQVGAGVYLLASSITSFVTVCLFTLKFWFFVLTHTNAATSRSILHVGCILMEPALKLGLYVDAWLKACMAIERAIAVSRGVKFDKERSQIVARWIILVLPFVILGSIIHEPMHRQLFDDWEMQSVRCVTCFPNVVQCYNMVILFFHFLAPFSAHLFSALFIIFVTVRQLREQKELLIGPLVLVALSLLRVMFSVLCGYVDPSLQRWLYLTVYFISFIPCVLGFVIFVLPSELYKKHFRESPRRWGRRIRRF
jgi:hypothetical protein